MSAKKAMKDTLKEKIRSTRSDIYEQFIDSDEEKINVNVNNDVNVNDCGNENVNVNQNEGVNSNRKKKVKKLKFEEKYIRHTSYIEKELLKQLNKEADGEKGEKTRIINEALRNYLKN